MELGFIGLGKMGANMVKRLLLGGHKVTVFDRSAQVVQELVAEGAKGASGLAELVAALPSPRVRSHGGGATPGRGPAARSWRHVGRGDRVAAVHDHRVSAVGGGDRNGAVVGHHQDPAAVGTHAVED